MPEAPSRTQASAEASKEPTPPSARERILGEAPDWEQNRMMRAIRKMTESMTETHYVHGIDVHVAKGIYSFDCSGMVDWLLSQAAPRARQSLRRGLGSRPLAADFVRHLARLEPGKQRGGWLRVGSLEEARPGDVIAWIKPKFIKSPNTGHVAILVLAPIRRGPEETAFLVRVADASRLMHEDDTRHGHGGYGIGTIMIESDPNTAAPSGFNFAGSLARRALGTKIVIGRPLT